MTIKQLHKRIVDAADNNQLAVTEALLNSSDYTAIANQYNISEILCQNPNVGSIQGGSFIVSGTIGIILGSEPLLGLNGNEAQLQFSIHERKAQLTLSYRLAEDWKPGNTFVLLDGTLSDNLPITFMELLLSTQEIDQGIAHAFPAGFSFSGTISLTEGLFTNLNLLFPDTESLPIAARISSVTPDTKIQWLTSELPIVDVLEASFRRTRLSVKDEQKQDLAPVPVKQMLDEAIINHENVCLDLKLLLNAKKYLGKMSEEEVSGILINPTHPSEELQIEMLTALDIGLKDNFISCSASFPILSNLVSLHGELQQPYYPLIQGLQQLERLFGSSNLADALPEPVKEIGDSLRLASVGFSFNLDNLTSLFSTQATLKIAQSFSLFPSLDILTVESLDFTWVVYHPFQSESRSIQFYSNSQVNIGGSYLVNLSLGMINDDYFLSLLSVEDQELELATLLRRFNIPSELLPQVIISGFQFQAQLMQKNYSFGVNLSEVWDIAGTGIHLSDVTLIANFVSGADPEFTATGLGIYHLPDSDLMFVMEGAKNTGWSFGGYLDGPNPTMLELLTALQSAFGLNADIFPEYFNQIVISDLSLGFASEPASFDFTIDGSLPILNTTVEIFLAIGLQKEDDAWSVQLSASILFSDEVFVFDFSRESGNNSFTASWTSTDGRHLNINQILSALDLEEISIPEGINVALNFKQASFSYDASQQEVTMQVTTVDDLAATFGTKKAGGVFRYYFALAYGSEFRLSQISESLALFEGIELNEPLVAIANFTDPSFVIPGFPFKGIVNGIIFRSLLTMESTDHQNILSTALNFLADAFGGNVIQVGINLGVNSDDFALIGSTDAVIPFPAHSFNIFTLNGIDLRIQAKPVEIELASEAVFNITLEANPPVSPLPIVFKVRFASNNGQTSINASLFTDTQVRHPFRIPVIELNGIGFGIRGTVGPNSNVAYTIVSNSLLGLESSNRKIPMVLNATIANRAGVTEVPYFESKVDGPISFGQILEACLPGITVPPPLHLLVLQKFHFFFCRERQVLPNGVVVEPGASFLAASSVWGFDSYLHLLIDSEESKIIGELDTNPFEIQNPFSSDQPLASVSGNGKGNSEYGIEPGGPTARFNSTTQSFSASVIASVMGIHQQEAEATLSNDGLQVTLNQEIPGIQGQVSILYKSPVEMSFENRIEVHIKADPEVPPFGNIHIDSGFSGSILMNVNPQGYSAVVSGSFEWQGSSINIVNANISQNLPDLEHLAEALIQYIIEHAKELFAQVLNQVENYIRAIIDKAITGGEFVANVLHGHYGIHDIDQLLNDFVQLIDGGVHIDGHTGFHLDKSLPEIPASGFHADTGLSIFGVGLSHHFGTPPVPVLLIDIAPNQHLDIATNAIRVQNSRSLNGLSFHIDKSIFFGHVGGGLGVTGKVGFDAMVPLNNLSTRPEAHIDGHFSGSLHGGFSIPPKGPSEHKSISSGKIHIDKNF